MSPGLGTGRNFFRGGDSRRLQAWTEPWGPSAATVPFAAPRSAQNLRPRHRKCGRRWPADGWVHVYVCLLENDLRTTQGFRPERERRVEEGNRNSFPLSFSHSITSIFQLQEELVCFSSGVEGS